jgi:hypothetical protein
MALLVQILMLVSVIVRAGGLHRGNQTGRQQRHRHEMDHGALVRREGR